MGQPRQGRYFTLREFKGCPSRREVFDGRFEKVWKVYKTYLIQVKDSKKVTLTELTDPS